MTSFIVVSLLAQNIKSEAKQFLLMDKADYMACGRTDNGLFYTKSTIEILYSSAVEEDNEIIIEEIGKILTFMHDNRAEMLFLN